MAGSFMKESGNSRGANRLAKMAPPLASGKNYHGRTLNVKVIDDSSESLYFRASVQLKPDGLLYVYTPSGDFTYVNLQHIKAVGKKEDDGLSWLIICISKFKKRQQMCGRNLLVADKKFLEIAVASLDSSF